MILSDREARAAIQRKFIGVTPCPSASDKRWSATTLDLTLDGEIRPWQPLGGAGADVPVDPSSSEFNSNELIRRLTQPQSCEGNGYVIRPQALVLGWTVEKVKLPNASRIGARVEGKSSLARIGLGIQSQPQPSTRASARRRMIRTFQARKSGWKSGTSAHSRSA